MTTRMFDKGETVFITCEVYSYDFDNDTWQLDDPDSGYPKISITDPAGKEVLAETAMTSDRKGKYQYFYTIPAGDDPPAAKSGWYDVKFRAVGGEVHQRSHDSFCVK